MAGPPTITRTIGKLASAYPAAGTPTRLYTAPQSSATYPQRQGWMSSSKIRIANNTNAATQFGIWVGKVDEVRGNNGTVAQTTTSPLNASQTIEWIAGDAIANGGWIDVQSGNGSVSFQLYGEEVIIDP